MHYNIFLFIHIVSVVLLLGFGGGSAYYKFMADRTGSVDIILHTNKLVVLADWLFTTPAVIVQPLTGFMLIDTLGLSWKTPWLLLSIILYILSIVFWLYAVYLQIKMKKLAISAKVENETLGSEYYKLVKYWIWLGVFSALAMGVVFYLMVFKF